MESAIRVLQAAELKLHEPLESVGSLTAPLREIFNQARERAALKIFNAAIQQRVDLLLLTGVLADFEAEPRLACFLMEQFRRLQAADISIVWTTSQSSLLPVWSLRPEQITCLLPGQSAMVFTSGSSRQILVHHASNDRFQIRTAAEFQAPSRDMVITVTTRHAENQMEVSAAGNTQTAIHPLIPIQHAGGQSQNSSGMRLIELFSNHQLRSTLIPVQTVRWATETIDVSNFPTRSSLVREIAQRSHLQHAAGQCEIVCLTWILTGAGPIWDELLDDLGSDQLLRDIRNDQTREPYVWTWKVQLLPNARQYETWTGIPALAEGLRQLNQLTTSDLSAAASVPESAGTFLRGPVLMHGECDQLRTRLARELRSPFSITGKQS